MRWAALSLVLVGCGPALGGPSGPVDTFVAFAADFSGYRHWEKQELLSGELQGDVHSTGQRTLYLSRRPPRGSRVWPAGTLLVKAVPGSGRVFAQVKRGGDFNAPAAPGWEWFELQHTTAEDVTVVWRGFGPPTGEGYGGDPNGCNVCHGLAAANDYVAAPGLRLSEL